MEKAMSSGSKSFRLFLSSTFSDLRSERDKLQEEVYPRLRNYCVERGFSFQVVDLRWGVSEEAGYDQQTLKICLDQVKYCQNYLNPHFAIILSERYGWVPIPTKIGCDEYQLLESSFSKLEKSIFDKWYKLDTNKVSACYILQARNKPDSAEDKAKEAVEWSEAETTMLNAFQRITAIPSIASELGDEVKKYFQSATEQEVIYGLLGNSEIRKEHIHFFRRKLTGQTMSNVDIANFIDTKDLSIKEADTNKAKSHESLLVKIGEELPPANCHSYDLELTGDPSSIQEQINNEHNAYLERFCNDFESSIKAAIDSEVERYTKIVEQEDTEEKLHTKFYQSKKQLFCGRESTLDAIAKYLQPSTADKTYPLIITGESGSGKTAFLAQVIQQAEDDDFETKVFYRFVGISENSSTGSRIVKSLYDEVIRFARSIHYSIDYKLDAGQSVEQLAKSYDGMCILFKQAIIQLSESTKIVVIIDALDQLVLQDKLQFIPTFLTDNLRFIVSTLPNSAYIERFKLRIPQAQHSVQFIRLGQLGRDEVVEVVDAFNYKHQRNLNDSQQAYLSQSSLYPIQLKILLEESTTWHSYTPETELLPLSRQKRTDNLILHYFASLVSKSHHEINLVCLCAQLLANSRDGLSEQDLLEILRSHLMGLASFKAVVINEFYPAPQNIPDAVWLRLRADLEAYLTEKEANQQLKLSFFHRKFNEVATSLNLENAHTWNGSQHLIDYYHDQLQKSKQTNEIKLADQIKLNAYKELNYQYVKSGQLEQAIKLLFEVEFLYLLTTSDDFQQVMDEYRLAYDEYKQSPAKYKDTARVNEFIQIYLWLASIKSTVEERAPEVTLWHIIYQLGLDYSQEFVLREQLLALEGNHALPLPQWYCSNQRPPRTRQQSGEIKVLDKLDNIAGLFRYEITDQIAKFPRQSLFVVTKDGSLYQEDNGSVGFKLLLNDLANDIVGVMQHDNSLLIWSANEIHKYELSDTKGNLALSDKVTTCYAGVTQISQTTNKYIIYTKNSAEQVDSSSLSADFDSTTLQGYNIYPLYNRGLVLQDGIVRHVATGKEQWRLDGIKGWYQSPMAVELILGWDSRRIYAIGINDKCKKELIYGKHQAPIVAIYGLRNERFISWSEDCELHYWDTEGNCLGIISSPRIKEIRGILELPNHNIFIWNVHGEAVQFDLIANSILTSTTDTKTQLNVDFWLGSRQLNQAQEQLWLISDNKLMCCAGYDDPAPQQSQIFADATEQINGCDIAENLNGIIWSERSIQWRSYRPAIKQLEELFTHTATTISGAYRINEQLALIWDNAENTTTNLKQVDAAGIHEWISLEKMTVAGIKTLDDNQLMVWSRFDGEHTKLYLLDLTNKQVITTSTIDREVLTLNYVDTNRIEVITHASIYYYTLSNQQELLRETISYANTLQTWSSQRKLDLDWSTIINAQQDELIVLDKRSGHLAKVYSRTLYATSYKLKTIWNANANVKYLAQKSATEHLVLINRHLAIIQEHQANELRLNPISEMIYHSQNPSELTNDPEFISLLKNNQHLRNQADDFNNPPLFYATNSGSLELLHYILSKGVEVNYTTQRGWTALRYEVLLGNLELVQELIKLGANTKVVVHGTTLLMLAAQKGYLEIVQELIASGADVNQVNNYGTTALIFASQNGYLEIVRELLANEADVTQVSNYGTTALMRAAQNGHREIAQELIANGANVDITDNDGWSTLIYAAQNGHVDIVHELLAAGAEVNHANDDGITALMAAAARNGHVESVRELLANGADVNQVNNYGMTSLMFAAKNGHLEIVKEIITHGADVHGLDNDGWSTLIYAARNGHVDIVHELLAAGAEVNHANDDGITALMAAARNGHVESVRELLAAGAEVNQAVSGCTALMIAAEKGHLEIVRELLASGAEINLVTNNGQNSLISAAGNGHLDTVRELLFHGADVNIVCDNGATALMVAAHSGHLDIVQELLVHKTVVNQATNDNGWTALILAAQNGYLAVVQKLLDNVAEVNQVNNDGVTALMLAAQTGYLDVVQVLIAHEADVNLVNNDGGTALIFAAIRGNLRTVRELIEHGVDVNLVGNIGLTSLICAAKNGHTKVVHELLAHEAEVNQVNDDGWTALMIAARNGHVDSVCELLAAGAAVNHANDNGWTALMIAAQNGHVDSVCELLAAGAEVNHANDNGWTALMIAAQNGHVDSVCELLAGGAEVNHAHDDGWTALMSAARNGHVDSVRELLAAGAEVNHANDNGWTALMFAAHLNLGLELLVNGAEVNQAKNNHRSVLVRELLVNGAEVNQANNDGMTALMLAAQTGHLSVVEDLIAGGANVDQASNNGMTTLMFAALNGHLSIVKELIMHGVNVNKDNNGWTAWMFAAGNVNSDNNDLTLWTFEVAETGHLAIVEELIAHRADAIQADNVGWTALMSAAQTGHLSVVEELIANGVYVNQVTNDGITALMLAAQTGHLAVVEELIAHGADVNQATNDGSTALMDAAQTGNLVVAKELIAHGADVNQSTHNGFTAWMFAELNSHLDVLHELISHGEDVDIEDNDDSVTGLISAAENGYLSVVQELIAHGADVNQADNYGTALMLAAENGYLSVVQELIAYGADVNLMDNNMDWTALMLAVQNGHLGVVEKLIAHGADVNQVANYGNTALDIAQRIGNQQMIGLLNCYSKPVNLVDNNGCTVLMVAAENDRLDVVEKLIAHGADVNQANNNGMTALMIAAKNNHLDIVQELIAYGADINHVDNNGNTAFVLAQIVGNQQIINLLV